MMIGKTMTRSKLARRFSMRNHCETPLRFLRSRCQELLELLLGERRTEFEQMRRKIW